MGNQIKKKVYYFAIIIKLYKLSKKYKNEILFFYNQILNDQYTSIKFKEDVKNFTSFIK